MILPPKYVISEKFIAAADIFVLLLFVMLAIFIRIRYIDLPLERDEGEYAYAGAEIANGFAPYETAYNMKFPGTYYVYAFIFTLFNKSITTIRISFLIIHLLNVLFVFLITKKIFDSRRAGFLGCCFFILLNCSFTSFGLLGKAEPLVVLFSLAGIFTILVAKQRVRYKLLFYLLAGGLMGTSVMMKQNGIFFCFAGWIFLLKSKGWIKNSIIYFSGILIPAILLLFNLLINNTFDTFYYFAIQYASEYSKLVNGNLGWMILKGEFPKLFQFNKPLFILSLISIVVLLITTIRNKNQIPLIIFFVCSVLAVSSGLYFRPHYFLLVYPAISIISAWFIYYIFTKPAFSQLKIVPNLLLLATLFYFIILQKSYIFEYDGKTAMRKIYHWTPFYECRQLGNNIKSITKPSATIGLIGCEPEIAFYADRQLASGFMYLYPMFEKQKYAMEMTNMFLSELEKNNPEIIIYSNVGYNSSENKPAQKLIEDWWKMRSVDYTLVENVSAFSHDQVKYLTGDSLNYQFDHWVAYIKVFKRNLANPQSR